MPTFNLNDVRKLDPGFHRQQLNYWHNQGYIKPLAGGYYILADRVMDEMLLFMVANKIYESSYIGLESALAYYEIIPETVLGVTSISSRKTKQYESVWGVGLLDHSVFARYVKLFDKRALENRVNQFLEYLNA